MGTLRSTDPLCQGAVVNGVTLGEPAEDADGNPLWDDARIPDGDALPVPTVTKGGKPAPDGKWVPPKDYVVTAEKAAKPVAIKPPAAKDRVAEEIA